MGIQISERAFGSRRELAMRRSLFFLSALVFVSGFLSAFSTPARADDDDPPGRVARLNYIQGSISFEPSGSTDWVQANPNRPLTTGDNLWTDKNSRGELHIGSTSLRVSSETGITFLNLDDRTVQIQLAQGDLAVHVRHMEGGDDFEIDTPNLAFTLHRPGEYRIAVDPNGNATTITVHEGEGDATGGGSEYHMDTGDRVTFTGTDTLTYDGGRAEGLDDFDEWCHSRDDREEHAQSARYVSRDVIGYDDLDDNGEWRSVPDYGTVWFPARVAAGWAPYRFGHWVFIAPWGWTWVEDEPWGFAPFHYGRWAEVGGGWCWVPGPVVVRPVYAPALVAFVGGPRFSIGVSFGGGGGGVAWFPLGPREVYVPPYRTSVRYVQNVNVTNTTVNVTNVMNVYNNVTVNNVNVNKITYMHQNNVNAVTAVSHDTFVNARPVAAAAVHVNAQQLQAAQVQHNFNVAPVQKSVVGAAPAATVRPPQAVMQREVVVKQTPAALRTPAAGNAPTRTFQPARGPVTQTQPQAQQQTQSRPPQSFPQGRPQTQQQQSQAQSQQQRPGQPQVQQQSQPFRPPQGQQAPQQQVRPQAQRPSQVNRPQPPPVKFAPPARATEETYHPHQFERPQTAAPPQQNQRPQERAPEPPQERSQPRPQEPNRPANEERKPNR
jgi:hypothetical protein